jgi:4'-phosphopantetheinyl transferase
MPAPVLLDGASVHLWRASLDCAPPERERLASLLSEDEQARAARLRVPSIRERFVAGRGLLRRLLGMYLAAPPESLRFAYRPHGKPYLHPEIGAPDIRFNLSHSQGLALFAFARGREVGVDLEIIRSDRDHTRLASRFFSAREVDALAALDPGDRMAGFFRCWTRKEAYLKARGEGLAIPLDSFSVSVGPEETACLLEADGAPAEAARWRIAAVDAAPGYAAALAVEGPLAQVEYFELAARF